MLDSFEQTPHWFSPMNRLEAPLAMMFACTSCAQASWQGAFLDFLSMPHAWIAVIGPMSVSLVLWLRAYRTLDRYVELRMVWWLSLPLMYATAHWRETEQALSLHILAWFSMACVYLAWRRKPVTPGLAYSLTFFSLFWVDLAHAMAHALRTHAPLNTFYQGIGGAGWYDGLFLFPPLAAAAIAYAQWRHAHPDFYGAIWRRLSIAR